MRAHFVNENVGGHALVGCASSVLSGGSCQSGALSAGVSAARAIAEARTKGEAPVLSLQELHRQELPAPDEAGIA